MPYKQLNTVLVIFCMTTAHLCAQSTTLSSGGEASGSGGSMSYSIGQLAYQSYAGSNAKLSEGMQQAYEGCMTTGIEELSGDFKLYPNPAISYAELEVENFEGLSYDLYDLQGGLLLSGRLIENNTRLDVRNLPKGSYFLRLSNTQNQRKSFTLIKY